MRCMGLTHAPSLTIKLQGAVKRNSVKRAARLRLKIQVGQKGNERAACLPRGHGLHGRWGLPIPHPGSGISASLSSSIATSHDERSAAMADTLTQCVRAGTCKQS